ncbi:glycosyltransferase family 4 protein [Novipirellula artificiosorum]|uniref:Glycosyl transferases group 1 n=1 Tax=Novipirellula artificiosorum TaxID=2528016 RepID=A0A5C6D561_9BACT|nr:glycosyltransferase family 4 protein [Novipirellula artificiosorum]TWU31990.1 Glycosyl transferases group 1 [Novipirellula artificiosorum]
MKTILVVTDQPFWRRQNGAQQRTWSLLQSLRKNGFQLSIFYLVERTDLDLTLGHEAGLSFVDFSPCGTRLRDRMASIVSKRLGRNQNTDFKENDQVDSPLRTPVTLETYRWPHAPLQFKSLIKSLRPDFVLSVYVVWANLLDAFPIEKRGFRAIVDTHDLLHVRQQQFSDYEESHWIEISKEEEATALQRFDLILATQQDEAKTLRSMAPKSKVIVVGHQPELRVEQPGFVSGKDSNSETIRLGFIGSNNAANVDGLRWFLQHCWSRIHQMTGAELIVAGQVAQGLCQKTTWNVPRVQFLGQVPQIDDFYTKIDIAINPVRFGSGLKIKSIESMCFGKPLVAHPHNTRGLPAATVESMFVADQPDRFSDACIRLIRDGDLRRETALRVLQICENELSGDRVYAGFLEWLSKCESLGPPSLEA